MTDTEKYVFLMGAPDDRTVQIAAVDMNRNVAYEWGGHNEFIPHLKVPPQEKEMWPLLWFGQDQFRIGRPKVIINCISNADRMTRSLEKAQAIIDVARKNWGDVPIYNNPIGIYGTTRDGIYNAFHTLPGFEIPRVVSCTPQNVRHLFELIETEKLHYPLIVRPGGSHGGDGMVLLHSENDRELLDILAFDGGAFYLIEYVDYRNADGQYVKSRFIWIDGAIYPRHSIAAESWKIHASLRGKIEGDTGFVEAEQDRLDNFEARMSTEARQSIDKIARTLGLNYLGFDVCLRDDGSLLVFEINASQNAMSPSDYVAYPHMRPYGERIIEAFNQSIAGLIGK